MSHLWLRIASADWRVLPLEADAYALDSLPPRPLSSRASAEDAQDGLTPEGATHTPADGSLPPALLLRSGSGETESWFAIARGAGALVMNGLPLRLAVRALSDRDEIRVPGVGAMFFSTETLARPVPYPGGDEAVPCLRCRQDLGAGVTAVRCPGCGAWYHESDQLHCWTYVHHCQR